MKLKSIFLTGLVIVLMSACSDDQGTDDTSTNVSTVNPMDADSSLSSVDSTSVDSTEDFTDGSPDMPKIYSSYFGQDPSGAEVTYNFFGEGKFEVFSFKNGQEKNISGTYKEEDGKVLLHSSEGDISLVPKEGNVYNVEENGKVKYTVKLIN